MSCWALALITFFKGIFLFLCGTYENEPLFYWSKSVVTMFFLRIDYHLYNHSFTTNTMVKLWLV